MFRIARMGICQLEGVGGLERGKLVSGPVRTMTGGCLEGGLLGGMHASVILSQSSVVRRP